MVKKFKEQKEFNDFDTEIEKIGTTLLAIDSANPYANYYMADYYAGKGINDKARKHYEAIINAKNFSRNWYTSEAENWLKQQSSGK